MRQFALLLGTDQVAYNVVRTFSFISNELLKVQLLLLLFDFTFLKLKHPGSDVFIFDSAGQVQTRFGRSGSYNGSVSWYHDLTIDKDENIYIGTF